MSMDHDRRRYTTLARYNRSVNESVFALLSALPEGAFDAERPCYFGSIRGVFKHILICDIHWMRRFREVFGYAKPLDHPRFEPAGHAWTKYEFGGFADLLRERKVLDDLILEFARTADTSKFGDVLAYADSGGNPHRYYFRDAFEHFFNHQTHHRGQLSQILDELGVEHDYSDLLAVLEIPPA